MSTRSWRSKVQQAAMLLALAPMALAASTAVAQNADSSAPTSASAAKPAKKRRGQPPPPVLSGTPTEVEAIGPAASASVGLPPLPASATRKGRRGAIPDLRQVVSSPGFQMLPSGGSRIEVTVMGKPKVLQYLTPGAVVYVFQNAMVPVHNNRNPLPTHFFNTPVVDARLRQVGPDVHLTLGLRAQVSPEARVVEMIPNRMLALQVDFGPGNYWTAPAEDPVPATRRVRGPSDQPGRPPSRPPSAATDNSVLGPPTP